MKNSRSKLLTTIFLTVLLISSAYAAFAPNVRAVEETAEERALSVLNEVVGLDTSAYTPYLNPDTNTTVLGLHQEDTNFNLIFPQGRLRVRVVFANSSLRQIYLSDYAGSPSFTQPTSSAVDMAKGFLEKYEGYTGKSFYGQLNSMLEGVAANTSVTKVAGNVKLEVSIVGDQVEENFVWTYIDANGVPALSKNVVLSYHNGLLESFLDNWQFYKIAGVPNISSQEAVEAALKAVESFSYMVRTDGGEDVVVSGFKVVSVGNATLSYLNYKEETATQSVRGGEPHTLYPSWYVPLCFDKVYPGSVTGARVRVWADTGEVSTIDPMVYSVLSSVNSTETEDSVAASQAPITAFLLAYAIMVGGTVAGVFCAVGNGHLGLKRKWKPSLSRFGITLLCSLILSSLLLLAVPRVNASGLKSEIYASLYGQITNEINSASNVEDEIQAYFEDADVDSDYNWGPLTTHDYVLSDIVYDVSNYDGVTVFHWGHGGATQEGTRYYDNTGDLEDLIWDDEDIGSTMSGNTTHFFVMLWVCMQAYFGPYGGMPGNWTKTDLGYYGNDGYVNSDNSKDHCFIGFYGASPTLSSQSFENYTALACDYIIRFYDYAVNQGYTVHDALNQASEDDDLFDLPYTQSPLYRGVGYETWWPGGLGQDEGMYPGHMEVFGDSNIHFLPYSAVSEATEWEYFGGWVDDAENLNGGANDGDFAHIHCPNYYPDNDMAMIIATLDKETSGHIAIYGRSGEGYWSDLLVYVSDDYENWACVNSLTITQSSSYWISIGDPEGNFRYIAVVGYNTQNSVCLYVDSVRVTP